ncbi:MAG TPA: galactose-1-phosphate uridylyltransferase [Gemmatimonadales bacterium]|nr:galactose-1-phosphate uridylyltransferase [Gemmatimonadales bacterium]
MTWEERWHPLRREWVIVSAHRNQRPWQGEMARDAAPPPPAHSADCYLCPGNARVSGAVNPAYTGVFVFDNDHPCVGPEAPGASPPQRSGLYRSRPAHGVSRVVCFTPKHDRTLARLGPAEFTALLETLQAQYRELGVRPDVAHVLVFENKGPVVGVSNPHPHCQIYATNFVFRTIELEAQAQAEHLASHGRTLFQEIIEAEEADGRRLVAARANAIAFVPYFARYPYEILVAPRATRASLAELTAGELENLGDALREALVRLENLWRTPMPYVMTLHQAPTDGGTYPGFHFYIEIAPPLRKPGLRKYLAGPELGGGNFLQDAAPEAMAAELRAGSAEHYLGQ